MSIIVEAPFQNFTGLDGKPLTNGSVYIGQVGTDPTVLANQIPIFWDEALTIAALQPLDTNAGYIVRTGTPARVYCVSDYSMSVKDSNGVLVYYVPSFGVAKSLTMVGSIADLRAIISGGNTFNAFVSGYYAPGDGGGSMFYADPSDTTSVDNGFTTIVATDGMRWKTANPGPYNVRRAGAKGDGLTNDQPAISLVKSIGSCYIPDGNFLINTPLVINDYDEIECSNKSLILAGANGINMLQSAASSYYARLVNLNLDGNNKTGITGFRLTNFRVGAILDNPNMTNMTNGMVLDGCFGTVIMQPVCYNGVLNPLTLTQNCAGLRVINPAFNNETGTPTNPPNIGTGITIPIGAIPNEGVVIQGGYIQGFDTGLVDNALATKVYDTYFENCTTADISSNSARNYLYHGCEHWAAVGACAYVARNCDAGTIFAPTMGSGGRTQFLDYDATNTNCYIYEAGSNASYNTPRGVDIGIGRIPQQGKGTFLPVLSGSGTAGVGTYVTQAGEYTVTGDNVEFRLTVACSAHTGTGAMVITGLPPVLSPLSYFPGKKFSAAYQFAFTGPVIYAGFNGTATTITPRQLTALGAEGLVPLPAGLSTTDIWGSYKFR